MKKYMNRLWLLAIVLAGLCNGTPVHAQDDSLAQGDHPASYYSNPLYDGPWRFIIAGVVIAVILGVCYRYYAAAKVGKDIWHDPQ